MLILFVQGTPRGIARSLASHTAKEARATGWDTLENGELLAAAKKAGFDVLITTDKNIAYQQNLGNRKIAIVALGKARWGPIRPQIAEILAAVNAAKPGSLTLVKIPDRR
jgi:hypothetical protein